MALLSVSFSACILLLDAILPASASEPLNCSDTVRVCTSFLAFRADRTPSLAQIQSMFDVLPQDVTSDEGSSPGYAFVRKNCACLSNKKYLANTTYTVRESASTVYHSVAEAYRGLAFLPNVTERSADAGSVVALRLFCGCSGGPWDYLMSYVMEEGDSIESLSSRFGVSMDSIEAVNGMTGPDGIVVGDVYYIPLNSVVGLPFSVGIQISPPAPASSPTLPITSDNSVHHSAGFPYIWILGSMVVSLALIIVALMLFISFKSFRSRIPAKEADQSPSHKFHILRNSSFCLASGSYLCCNGDVKSSAVNSGTHQNNTPKSTAGDCFDMEKPIFFKHEELLSCTDNFSDVNLLGHGKYGSVYYGVLRDQEVAIKRMTAMETKEFIAEMKVLCKVHHSSLVELTGYASTNDELFLIYEYAPKGSLKNHLHDPQNKGQTLLSWISRVQISLDAARGLEYIHEHTKDHYLHRDMKTSNILLDNSFRAKISDFGLAKLVAKTCDGEASTTKVVGTFGYLAPEYLHDGLATTKSDVYAFGVVLFELITSKEAITRTEGLPLYNSERRSLASIMLAALRNTQSSVSMGSLRHHIDPSLMDLYPYDCVYKMAMLAKQCVDEDPVLRPDMKQVVISLSQILLSSVEWEATLAGNSQVFSGLVQGR